MLILVSWGVAPGYDELPRWGDGHKEVVLHNQRFKFGVPPLGGAFGSEQPPLKWELQTRIYSMLDVECSMF